MLTAPDAPKKNTIVVCMSTYSDSNPMIEGVMMRLLVTVWNVTVASAWQKVTVAITTIEVTRIVEMRHQRSLKSSYSLPHVRSRIVMAAADAMSAARITR